MNTLDAVPESRRDRLDSLLDREGLSAVWFGTPNGFAWLTGGDNVVDRAGNTGIAAAGYDGEDVTVVTTNIEADRLRAEEVPDDVVVESYEWYTESLTGAVRSRSQEPAAADFDVPGFQTIDPSALRQPLTDRDLTRYRALGTDVAETMGMVCRGMSPEDTEQAIAARLRGALAEQGIEAHVALVGGSDRAQSYRHYTPTTEQLGDYALVSVSAMRAGLVVSCTRTVAFDAPEWLEDRHTAATRVETTALAATKAVAERGGTAADVFSEIQTAYDTVGWDGEWKRHHQGGAAGFAGREWIATPDLAVPVHTPMAYAWNPTVQGAKSEGTVVVDEDGFDPLTDGDWPSQSASAVNYDTTLDRPAILTR